MSSRTLHRPPWYVTRKRSRTSVKSHHKCFRCGSDVRGGKAYDRHVEGPCFGVKGEGSYILELDAWEGYRMVVAIDAQCPLSLLDAFLRQKWMDCCGRNVHKSCFKIPAEPRYIRELKLTVSGEDSVMGFGAQFEENDDEDIEYLTDLTAKEVFGTNRVIGYEFDGGRIVVVRVVRGREGRVGVVSGRSVVLLLRNYIVSAKCGGCGGSSSTMGMCKGCGAEDNMDVFYCLGKKSCASACDHGGPVTWRAVVNSPRMGLCAFDGERDDDVALLERKGGGEEGEGEVTALPPPSDPEPKRRKLV